LQGTVKKWLDFKGFGFIQPDNGGDDVFIHNSEIKGAHDLKEGQKVEFDVENSYKGPKAINLTIIE
jgi:CspA family cold shock protein